MTVARHFTRRDARGVGCISGAVPTHVPSGAGRLGSSSFEWIGRGRRRYALSRSTRC
jgi:hypothetical protein